MIACEAGKPRCLGFVGEATQGRSNFSKCVTISAIYSSLVTHHQIPVVQFEKTLFIDSQMDTLHKEHISKIH